MRDDLLKIIEHYGVIHQLKKFNEESYELIEAARDYQEEYTIVGYDKEKVDTYFIDCIAEELADCMVLLEQIKVYYNLDNEKIIDEMKHKINRQLKRMEGEKNE